MTHINQYSEYSNNCRIWRHTVLHETHDTHEYTRPMKNIITVMIALMEFMYTVFTHIPGESYHR